MKAAMPLGEAITGAIRSSFPNGGHMIMVEEPAQTLGAEDVLCPDESRRMTDEHPATREFYRHFLAIPTRWMDNDVYGHVNNVTYYSYFDTVVNKHLVEEAELDPEKPARSVWWSRPGASSRRNWHSRT